MNVLRRHHHPNKLWKILLRQGVHFSKIYCVKRVRIRSYSGPYFPAFGLNTKRYSVTSNTDTFYAVNVNNTYSKYEKIISGIPQSSIRDNIFQSINKWFILFLYLMSRFTIFPMTTYYLTFAEKIVELIDILQPGSEIVIDWFKNNKMIVNPDIFQTILLDKRKSDLTNQHIAVDNQNKKSCIICRITRNSGRW